LTLEVTLDLGLNFKKEGREIEYLQYLWRAFDLRDLEVLRTWLKSTGAGKL